MRNGWSVNSDNKVGNGCKRRFREEGPMKEKCVFTLVLTHEQSCASDSVKYTYF